MYARGLKCISCKKEFPLTQLYECDSCGGILDVIYDYEELKNNCKRCFDLKNKCSDLLPVRPDKYISLGEGNTVLIEADRLARRLDLKRLLLKCEFSNPTGSFKDRPVSIGISKAVEFGYKKVVVASSGNGAAAVAAYAARAGLEAVILVPDSTPSEKVRQSSFYGATVIRVEGPYSNCFNLAKEVGQKFNIFNLTTTFINPYTLEGDKMVAFELLDQMEGSVPGVIYVPIGAGPLLVGIYKGYNELYILGKVNKLPKMAGIQAEGCSPIARAFLSNQSEVKSEDNPHTVAGGICDGLTGYSKDGTYTLNTIRQSKGFSIYCSDESIIEAQKWLAKDEGVFVEPSSAAAVAGIVRSIEENRISKDSVVVALLTGHGLKDVGKVQLERDIPVIPNDVGKLIELLD